MRVSPSELYDVPTDVDDDGVWDIGFAECVKNIEPLAIDIAAGAHGLRREARIETPSRIASLSSPPMRLRSA